MNKNALSDHYVRAIRWAADRLKSDGIVAFVTNNSFLEAVSFDGFRKTVAQEFTDILHVNLKGDARTSAERRRAEGGNVFDDAIKVSVGITFFVKTKDQRVCNVQICEIPDYWKSQQKRDFLASSDSLNGVAFAPVDHPDRNVWSSKASATDFASFLSLWSKDRGDLEVIFEVASNGLKTNRDVWVYGSSAIDLATRTSRQIEFFNSELSRWINAGRPKDIDTFVLYDDQKISWSRDLKKDLSRAKALRFDTDNIRTALYRPFDKRSIYFDRVLNEEVYVLASVFPKDTSNLALVFTDVNARSPFATLASSVIPDVHVCASDAFHLVSFYTYDEDGSNRRENITDWALDQFRSHYNDKSISKWDIFYYTYAVLHNPEYRTRYAANLKRELPRIPYAPEFHSFAKAGKRLAELHVDYEKQKEYPLERVEKPGQKLDFRVEKMRLNKDKQTLVYNDFLSLTGIPTETFDYRLGNRSALEWVIDQYQVSTDKRSGITNDPNRADDPEYILRLIGQVITVSLETVKIVNALPDLGLPQIEDALITAREPK